MDFDDLNLLSDHEVLALCAEDRSLPSADWCNWKYTRSGNAASPNRYYGRSVNSAIEEFDTDRQGLYAQVSKGPSVYQDGRSDFGACGEPSFVNCSTRALEASASGRADCELQCSVDWMDETFLNSLLEEDPRNMENPLESLNMPDSIYRSVSSENLLTDMLMDQMSHAATNEPSTSTGRFPVFTNDISETWGRAEDSQPSCFVPEEPTRSKDSATDPDLTVMPPTRLTPCNENGVVVNVDEQKYLEATVLQDLEDITIQLSDRMRACFRDALYRLAMNSKEQYKLNQMNDENSSMRGAGYPESKTNVIDRTIANLMFNKPCYVSPSDTCTGSFHSSMKILAPPGSFYSLKQPIESYYYHGPTMSSHN